MNRNHLLIAAASALVLIGGLLLYFVTNGSGTSSPMGNGQPGPTGDGSTALLDAAARGDLRAIATAVQTPRVDLNARHPQSGATPLVLAVSGAHVDAVKLLLDSGADPNLADKGGRMPLWIATRAGDHATVAALAQANARVDVTDEQGRTPLLAAVETGSQGVARALIDAGAALDARDATGRTALMVAAGLGDERAVSMLLAAGASLNVRDSAGRSAAWLAAGAPGNSGALRALIDARVDINTPDAEGVTPLMVAAEAGLPTRVILLLNAGADPHAHDKLGRAALDHASARADESGSACSAILADAAGG